jgi:DNA-directed RNA polymerase subunit alpha
MLDIQKYIWTPKIVTHEIDECTTIFEVQFLPRWFGHSLWNALRRAILWYSASWSVTALKCKGVPHEYHVVDWIRESVLDIMLNFKALRFKIDENIEKQQWISMRFKWIWKYTWWDLKLPSWVELLNPELWLLEIGDVGTELIGEFRLEKGYGYHTLDFLRAREEQSDDTDINILLIDNDFKAVEYVKYSVEDIIDDFSWRSKDKLILEIKTISPTLSAKEMLSFAGEVLSSYAKLFIFDDAFIDKSQLVDYYDIVDQKEKKNDDSSVKTIPIDALPLSERTRNALIKNAILYVEDLEKKRKSELLTMKWIGRKAVDEIIDALHIMWRTLEW